MNKQKAPFDAKVLKRGIYSGDIYCLEDLREIEGLLSELKKVIAETFPEGEPRKIHHHPEIFAKRFRGVSPCGRDYTLFPPRVFYRELLAGFRE